MGYSPWGCIESDMTEHAEVRFEMNINDLATVSQLQCLF